MYENKEHIVISGAGLVGSLLALYLAKRGHKVSIYERRPDMRKAKISAGKSINLALSDRGWRALEQVGVADRIRQVAIPMKGRMIHDLNGELTFQPYGIGNQAIYSVSRGGLNMEMMTLAEENQNVSIYFNERTTDVDLDKGILYTENTETGKKSEVKADRIFGADGAFSSVRAVMQKSDRFTYSQTYIEHSYKELHIPGNPDNTWKIEKNALHIWPRKDFMLIALPNMDGSFTCTLFLSHEGKDDSFERLKTDDDIKNFFNKYFPDAVKLMPTLVKDFKENPTSSLCIIRCFPWTHSDKVALIGDAAHAIVPFYGQGMNAGFEDCRILEEIMDAHKGDWRNIFKKYEISRKPNGDAIADLALQNFIEMRDLVGDKDFIKMKKFKLDIYEKYPDFIPQYPMVTFSHIPYSEALRLGKEQDKFIESLMKKYDSVDKIPQEDIDFLIGIK